MTVNTERQRIEQELVLLGQKSGRTIEVSVADILSVEITLCNKNYCMLDGV